MYKYLSLALLATMMQLSADTATSVDGKMYVRPRAVRVMKKGIVVHTKDGAFIAPTISRDENGLFVQEKDLVKAPAIAQRKKCGGCKKKWAANGAQNVSRQNKSHWKNKKQWKNKYKSAEKLDVQVETPAQ